VSRSGLPVGDLPDRGQYSVDLQIPGVALAVGAHPDDIEFGCGGTLSKWTTSGCKIHHLVLTDGSKGTWEADQDIRQLIETRKKEQAEAAVLLGGGDVTFLDWTDGELESSIVARRQVCEVIRRVKPDVVLGHDPWRRYRIHPDHRNAGWLLTDAVVAARDPKFFPDIGPAPHRPSAVLLFEADETNHVEILQASHLSLKVSALLAHRSQYETTFAISDGSQGASDEVMGKVRAQMSSHGSLVDAQLGEAFHLIDDI
jgi:LmbE family N-acetylglucosaminyl deacetylase